MSHGRRAGVAVQEEPETGDMPWWESRVPRQAPPGPVRYDLPGQWGERKAPPRPQPSPAAAQPSPAAAQPSPAAHKPKAPASSQASAPASEQARMLVATPEDRAQSEAAAAAPQSYITTDDRKKSYADLGVPETLDPLSSSRFLWQLARRFALYSVVTAVVDFAFFLLGLIFFLLGRNSAVLGLVRVVDLLSIPVLLLLFWLLPVPALLGHWSRLLSFQAPAAMTALDCVARALDHHATPADKLATRLISPPGEGRRHYLELRHGYFAGYISCFPHGHDLYVGWTFWIHISPLRVLLMRIGRKVQDHTGGGNDMYQTLRFESARATVAAIHTCTLEGVDVATGASPSPVRAPAAA